MASIPNVGVLEGVRVVHATQSIAGPFGPALMADWGADVIWVENPVGVDVVRWMKTLVEQDRRNQRSISLDIPSPEGRKVFFELIKDAHIFIEASKGGQYQKWGLTDEVLWEQNPALVIVHVSGFGQDGDPDYVKRPSYDPIAQAFGGLMAINGFPDRPPIPSQAATGDIITALFVLGSALAALRKAEKTGKGESIDIAQYECLVRCQTGYPANYANNGIQFKREGSKRAGQNGWGTYSCKDGKDVYVLIAGGGVLKKAIVELGLEYGSELFPQGVANVFTNTPGGDLFEEKLVEYFSQRTAEEVEKRFSEVGVPCCRIMEYEQMIDNSHYLARGTFTEWDILDGSKFKGINIVPRFKNSPGQIWRGCPSTGLDNEAVLSEIGLSDEQISALYEKKVIDRK